MDSIFAHAGNTPEWQSAIDLFVTNAANLMKAIKDTLRAAKLAQAIPNNFISLPPPTIQQFPPHFASGAKGHPPPMDTSFHPLTAAISATMRQPSIPAMPTPFQGSISAAGVTGVTGTNMAFSTITLP